ncbi:hypothetical protein HME9302_01494 [Alteripontixanthobacter maritimus]|uniref:HTH marR-type domain-containing protein n=1 Tax=Alteripontixanthobacter maritimus TaxID=2161824 RepID=A0A369Q5Y0_9SPHN|nr:MarR family transcriptional regulator [Alteripontixanthobacter maritimus]RDC60293.1 hypothetical protein HME9302_01494 [Alteripontixanthobacter maritimus]
MDQASKLARGLLLIGNQLLALAGDAADLKESVPNTPSSAFDFQNDSHLWLALAKHDLEERRRRRGFIDPSMLGDAGWEILLDLYIAAKERTKVATMDVLVDGTMSHTTGLRWIEKLESAKLVEREQDASDSRRKFLRLSLLGYQKMTAYFSDGRKALLEEDLMRTRTRTKSKASEAEKALIQVDDAT